MTPDEWVRFCALLRGVWPQGELPDETVELWYKAAGRRWAWDVSQLAVVRLATVSTHFPTLAELVEARDAAARELRSHQPTFERRGPAATPEEVEGWLRVIRGMRQVDRDHPLRQGVRDLICDAVDDRRALPVREVVRDGRVVETHLVDDRWTELGPIFGDEAARSILDELSGLLPPPPPPEARGPGGGGAASEGDAGMGERGRGLSAVGGGVNEALLAAMGDDDDPLASWGVTG
jgi:hypothetical protein